MSYYIPHEYIINPQSKKYIFLVLEILIPSQYMKTFRCNAYVNINAIGEISSEKQ